MRHIHSSQRGFSLILALVFLVMLTIYGMTVVNNTAFDVQVSGAQRAATSGLYVAEQGIARGLELITNTCGLTATTTAAELNVCMNRAEFSTIIGMTHPDIPIRGWQQVMPPIDISEQADPTDPQAPQALGTAHVAIRDNDDGDGDFGATVDTTILMRAVAHTRWGTRRVIETAVGIE